MMINTKFRLFTAAVLAVAATAFCSLSAQDFPKVACIYSGTWQGNSSDSGSGPIQWKIQQQEICCGMWGIELTGSGSDSYGSYKLSGSCGDGSCFVEQVYVSGQLKGSEYYYKGDYQMNNQTMEMTSINGQWGEKNKAASGPFSITKIQCN